MGRDPIQLFSQLSEKEVGSVTTSSWIVDLLLNETWAVFIRMLKFRLKCPMNNDMEFLIRAGIVIWNSASMSGKPLSCPGRMIPRSFTLNSWPAVHSPAWTKRRAAGFLAESEPMLRSISGDNPTKDGDWTPEAIKLMRELDDPRNGWEDLRPEWKDGW